jgi:hypothetical protein
MPERRASERKTNPVSVISGPIRLSRLSCQAISPQATNDPPTERLTTSTAVTLALSRNRKTNAVTSAAIPSGHSTSGNRAAQGACLMLALYARTTPAA